MVGKAWLWEWDVVGFIESTLREQSGKIPGLSYFRLFTFYVVWTSIKNLPLNPSENALIDKQCLPFG